MCRYNVIHAFNSLYQLFILLKFNLLMRVANLAESKHVINIYLHWFLNFGEEHNVSQSPN